MMFWLAACAAPPVDPPAELVHAFTFAIVADPHVAGSAEHVDRLEAAVDAINVAAPSRQIELVLVVGDIGWSGHLPEAKGLLDELDVPYVPILGDNEIQFGDEQAFSEVFAPVYAELGSKLQDFSWSSGAVPNPEHGVDSWFVNLSFRHRGVHFVGLDWNTRVIGSILGEMANLHDFEGGTWPWFDRTLDPPYSGPEEDIVMLSHHPMHLSPGAFDIHEMETLTDRTFDIGHRVAANYAGHYHFDHEETVLEGGYELFITDATWDDINRVRLVEVWVDDERFEYRQELVDVP